MRSAALCAAAAAALPGLALGYEGNCTATSAWVWGTSVANQPAITLVNDGCTLTCGLLASTSIPSDIGSIKSTCASAALPLAIVILNDTKLTGQIPAGFGQMGFPFTFSAPTSQLTGSLANMKNAPIVTLNLANNKLTGSMADNFAGWGSTITSINLDNVTTITGSLSEFQTALKTGGANLATISWSGNGKGTANGCFDSFALDRDREAAGLPPVTNILLDAGQACPPTKAPTLPPVTGVPSTAYPTDPPSTFAPVAPSPTTSRNPTMTPTTAVPTLPPSKAPTKPTPRTQPPGSNDAAALGTTLVGLVASAACYLLA